MITIQTTVPAIVGLPGGGEVYLASAGQWSLSGASYVTVGTNAQVNLPVDMRTGACVLVDGSGLVGVVDGPDLVGSSIYGFALAFSTIGVWLGIKYAWRKIMGAGGMSAPVD